MLLSILIPVYNERTVVERSLAQVLAAPLPENMQRELIIVDDCSTDGTSDILERLVANQPGIRLIRQDDVPVFDVQLTTMRAELDEAVEQLNERYGELRSTARTRLGRLFNSAALIHRLFA